MNDPTHGRIDQDIQAAVAEMEPESLAQRVAIENTLQERREKGLLPYTLGGPVPKPVEAVNHPAHYGGDTTYEAIKVIEAWQLGFCLGNTVKYIRRADEKGTAVEDLEKARWYLDREIARRKTEPSQAMPCGCVCPGHPGRLCRCHCPIHGERDA